MEDTKCRLVTWDEIASWTRTLARKVRDHGFIPDVVVGLTRGGWVPARLLCDHFSIKNLYSVKTEHWGLTATKDGSAKLAAPLGVDVSGKRVLVVDDITDTGQSLQLALNHVRSLGPAGSRTGTLLHITHSMIVPDYYTVEVPKEDWTWFIFPWNFNEDIRNFVAKAQKEAGSPAEIRSLLKRHCQIDVPVPAIEDALVELARKKQS